FAGLAGRTGHVPCASHGLATQVRRKQPLIPSVGDSPCVVAAPVSVSLTPARRSPDRIRQLGEPPYWSLTTPGPAPSCRLSWTYRWPLRESKPPRLLLLARGAGDWWRELPTRFSDSQLLLARVSVRELPPLAPGISGRGAVYRA